VLLTIITFNHPLDSYISRLFKVEAEKYLLSLNLKDHHYHQTKAMVSARFFGLVRKYINHEATNYKITVSPSYIDSP